MFSSPAPLLSELGEAARVRRVSRRLSETRQGLGDEGEEAGMHSTGFEFGIAETLTVGGACALRIANTLSE